MSGSSIAPEVLTVSETLGRVLSVYGSRKMLFWKLAAIVSLPTMISTIVVKLVVASMVSHMEHDDDNGVLQLTSDVGKELLQKLPLLLLMAVVWLLFTAAIGALGTGAMVRATAELHIDRDPQWMDMVQKALKLHFMPLFGAGFALGISVILVYAVPLALMTIHPLAWLGVLLMMVAPFGVYYLMMRLYTLYPVIVVEKTSAMTAFGRAFTVSRGAFCYFFCTSLVITVGLMMAYVILQVFLFGAGGSTMAVKPGKIILEALCQQLPNIFFLPCFPILQTVLYFSQRARREGLTKDMLAREINSNNNDGGAAANDDLASPLLGGGDEDNDEAAPEVTAGVAQTEDV